MKKITSVVLSAVMTLSVFTAGAGYGKAAAGELELAASSILTLDRDSGYVSGISTAMTVSELAAEFADPSSVTVKDGDTTVAGDKTIASDYVVTNGDDTLKCAVMGDVNRDGKISIDDAICMLKYVARWDISICEPAMDVNSDSQKSVSDVIQILKYVAGWDVTLAPYRVVFDDSKIDAAYEDSALKLSVLDNMQKIDQRDTAIGDSTTIRMHMAKNEIESCLIYLASDKAYDGLTAEFTDFYNGHGGKLETEMTLGKYIYGRSIESADTRVYYADPMIPNADFKIKAGNSQCLLLKANAAIDAAPGLYESTVTIKDSAGRAIKVCKVYVDVWDFALPEETSCTTAFGMSRESIYQSYGSAYFTDGGQLYKNYYDYLLENRICAYYLPSSVLSDDADEYMNNPRVNSFIIDGTQCGNSASPEEDVRAMYEKLSKNEEWMKKGYFYYVDEPRSAEQLNEIKSYKELLDRAFPGARQVAPNCFDFNMSRYGIDLDMDQTQFILDNTTLFCPLSSFYTPYDQIKSGFENITYSKATVDRYGAAEARHEAYKNAGNELWWYVCIIPGYPYANFFFNYQGEMSRVLFWQQYDYDIAGCLYYAVTMWEGSRMWIDADGTFASGDGLLIYPGKRYGTDYPIESIRLEYVRDGIEDFEYLKMAENVLGRDAVNEVLRTVTTGILDYTNDSAVIEAAKVKLAEMIMSKN